MPANPEPQPWTPEEIAIEIAYHQADAARYPGQYRADKSLRLAATLSSYSRLLAEGEELRKDKERLDWLDKHRIHVPASWGYSDERWEWSITGRGTQSAAGTRFPTAHDTVRLAIDAARSEGGKDG